MKRNIFCVLIALVLFGCKDDDSVQSTLDFTQEQVLLMHGGSEKTWRVKQLFSEYSRSRLSQLMPCHVDDTYTFKANTGDVLVTMGDESCFWDNPDQELSDVLYTYYEESGELFLDHARGEVKDAESSQIFYILKLREISETEMLFANGAPGNYGRAILFEAMD